MTTTLTRDAEAGLLEQVVIGGDLKALSPAERVRYYQAVCASLNLNPLTQPFAYIVLNSKLTLYARKDATDQLRSLRHVSIAKLERETVGDLYVVTAYAQLPDGRQDSEIGAVSIKGLAGEALANALMKATTKSKRRVTLSICGLGVLDETETETIPDAVHVDVDTATGEVLETPRAIAAPAQPGAADEALRRLLSLAAQQLTLSDAEVFGIFAVTGAEQLKAYLREHSMTVKQALSYLSDAVAQTQTADADVEALPFDEDGGSPFPGMETPHGDPVDSSHRGRR